MKNIFILLLFAFFSCTSNKANYSLNKSSEIVDYNQSYEDYNSSFKLNESIKRINEQTIILYNNKIISKSKFQSLLNKNKIKSLESIQDKEKIAELGYSFKDVKRILITKK